MNQSLLLIVLLLSPSAFAASFFGGDRVLAPCGDQLRPGVVLERHKEGARLRVRFDSTEQESNCGRDLQDSDDLLRRDSVKQAGRWVLFALPPHRETFTIGESVLARCSEEQHSAKIVDLTENGQVLVQFEEPAWDAACGTAASSYLDLSDIEKI